MDTWIGSMCPLSTCCTTAAAERSQIVLRRGSSAHVQAMDEALKHPVQNVDDSRPCALQMKQLEGTFDAACRVAAALPQEKRATARHRGTSATRRSSNIAVRRSSMAQQDPSQLMVGLRHPVDGCAMAPRCVMRAS
jgi:hypothetical protein